MVRLITPNTPPTPRLWPCSKPGSQLEEKEFPYFSLNLVSVRTLSAFEDVYIYPLRKGFIFHDCCGPGLPQQKYDYVRRLGLQHPISKIVEMTGLKARHVHKILSRAEDIPSRRPKSLSPECCTNLIKLQQTGQLHWDHQYSPVLLKMEKNGHTGVETVCQQVFPLLRKYIQEGRTERSR